MIRTALLASLVCMSACGGKSKPAETQQTAPIENKQPAVVAEAPPLTENEKALAAMEKFGHDMCACKDTECAKAVSDDMTKWSQKQAQAQKEPIKLSDEEMKRAVEIGTRMGECMQKAMGAGGPP